MTPGQNWKKNKRKMETGEGKGKAFKLSFRLFGGGGGGGLVVFEFLEEVFRRPGGHAEEEEYLLRVFRITELKKDGKRPHPQT